VSKSIVAGSRGSKLALAQTQIVTERIRALFSDVDVRLVEIVTHGDRDQSIKLDVLERDGVFVRELEEGLLDGRIDMAVHSLKDVPTKIPAGLTLASVLEREDPRDVLITRGEKLAGLKPGAKIGTSSLRRTVQLANMRPDVVTVAIRGNVDTRMRKVADGEFDGVVLAAAGLVRLGWQDRITEYLPVEQFVPAVGQAALVIETRSDDENAREIATRLNHLPTWWSITAERAFLWAVGGGCSAPIAALANVCGDSLSLDGMVASVRTRRILRAVETGTVNEAGEIGRRLARRLLATGAGEFIAEAEGAAE
jgi:hydroxymethylbilane synthase